MRAFPVLPPMRRPTGVNSGLPTANAIGIWPMDDGSGLVARNTVGGTPDNNLWHAPEVGFTNQTSTSGGASSTDSYAAGPDGRTRAVRVNFSASGSKYLNNFACTSGVAHTLSFQYKRTGGSDQVFKAYADSASGELAATDTWQTHTQTWTPATATPTVGFAHNAAFDIIIAEFKVEQGSSATPYVAPRSHIVFQGNKKPTWSSAGIVTSAADRGAYAARNIDATLSQLTYYHAFKQSGTPETNYNTLSHFDTTVNKWHCGVGSTNGFADVAVNTSAVRALGTKAWDTNWHVLCCRYDGSNVRLYLDGVMNRVIAATGTLAASYLRFFSLFTQVLGAQGTHGYAAWYDTAHDDQTILDSTEFIRTEIVGRGETFPAYDRIIACEGDSLFQGNAYAGLSSIPERLVATATGSPLIANIANAGSVIPTGTVNNSLTSRVAMVDGILNHPATTKILLLQVGTNDLNTGDAATYLTNLKAYAAARRAAGWYVITATVLPTTLSGFNAKRATANADLVNPAHIGVYWDALVDQAADATVGPDAAASNATYYQDGTHPTNAANAIIEPLWTTKVNAV